MIGIHNRMCRCAHFILRLISREKTVMGPGIIYCIRVSIRNYMAGQGLSSQKYSLLFQVTWPGWSAQAYTLTQAMNLAIAGWRHALHQRDRHTNPFGIEPPQRLLDYPAGKWPAHQASVGCRS